MMWARRGGPVVIPEPLSPTTAVTAPGVRLTETPSTAWSLTRRARMPRLVLTQKYLVRSRPSRTGATAAGAVGIDEAAAVNARPSGGGRRVARGTPPAAAAGRADPAPGGLWLPQNAASRPPPDRCRGWR